MRMRPSARQARMVRSERTTRATLDDAVGGPPLCAETHVVRYLPAAVEPHRDDLNERFRERRRRARRRRQARRVAVSVALTGVAGALAVAALARGDDEEPVPAVGAKSPTRAQAKPRP